MGRCAPLARSPDDSLWGTVPPPPIESGNVNTDLCQREWMAASASGAPTTISKRSWPIRRSTRSTSRHRMRSTPRWPCGPSRRGAHVLVEKPLGVTAAEARRIAEAARSRGVFAMEAMWMKFNPAFRAFADQARAGRIGEIRGVRGYFGLPFGPEDSTRWAPVRASSTQQVGELHFSTTKRQVQRMM